MIDHPIRKRQNIYPKDFTPSQRVLNTQLPQKTTESQKKQFSFSCRRQSHRHINRSTQLLDDQNDDLKNAQPMLTINPEEAKRYFPEEPQKQLPLLNQHLQRKKPYLNPEILSKPRIEEKIYQEIPQVSDLQGESITPGSIKNNKAKPMQQPLSEENPASLFAAARHDPNKKMDQTHSSFQQLLRNNQLNIPPGTQPKKCASLGRGGMSEQNTSLKMTKKFSIPMSQTPRQSSLLIKNRSANHSPERANLFSYGYLLQQNKVSKLKNHINQFISQRHKNKTPRTHKQTQSDYATNEDLGFKSARMNSRISRTKNILSATKLFPQLGQSGVQLDRFPEENDVQVEEYEGMNNNFSPIGTHQNIHADRQILVTYKTSMNSLKQIFKTLENYFRHHKKAEIQIRVPQVLMGLKISMNLDKQALYSTALQLFQQLQIPSTNLNIKRYSNCVIMVAKSICIIYHYSSKIYLGSWQTMYLDEGVRHGIGLEWVPNKYVYYGEYVNNKREGLGIYKQQRNTFMGEFRQSQKISGYTINSIGQLYPQGQDYSQPASSNRFYNSPHEYIQSEPAMF